LMQVAHVEGARLEGGVPGQGEVTKEDGVGHYCQQQQPLR
jgi:hypothetical protein